MVSKLEDLKKKLCFEKSVKIGQKQHINFDASWMRPRLHIAAFTHFFMHFLWLIVTDARKL